MRGAGIAKNGKIYRIFAGRTPEKQNSWLFEEMADIGFLDLLGRGFCVGLAASITVGPVAVLCIQRTISKSGRSGYASGAGVACADTLMAIIAFFFYSMLKESIEQYSDVLRVCGGIFVIIVGVCIFFQNPVPQIRRNRAGRSSMVRDFVSIFGFTLANFVVVIPYLLAFFALFMKSGADNPGDLSTGNSATIIIGFFIGALTWWVVLTSIVNLFRRRFRPRHLLALNHVAGIVISLLGIYTILSTYLDKIMPNALH